MFANDIKEGNHRWFPSEYDSTKPDVFRYDHGYHNGPECQDCGLKFCEHCTPWLITSDCPGAC